MAAREDGGASRDRTGDLKLAKLALSQLSYGPAEKCHGDSNRVNFDKFRDAHGGPRRS
jgi:hypothetical protein